MEAIRELPDRVNAGPTVTYGVRVSYQTLERIKIINAYKDGLTEQIREAIDALVGTHWDRLQTQQRSEK